MAENYPVHQQEIFSSIITEYTDWENSMRHPVSVSHKTLEALQDALYVAPIVETGDVHSSLNKNSWFYLFNYQSKNSPYKQVSHINVYLNKVKLIYCKLLAKKAQISSLW